MVWIIVVWQYSFGNIPVFSIGSGSHYIRYGDSFPPLVISALQLMCRNCAAPQKIMWNLSFFHTS